MAQIIFENLETLTQHLYPSGFMFQHLPRIGEEVAIYDEETDEDIIHGVVENVNWSLGRDMESENDYSVFIYIRPTKRAADVKPRRAAKVKSRKVSRG